MIGSITIDCKFNIEKISDGDEYLQFIPESEWKWLGDGKGKYQNGIIEEKSPSRCVDIDAACFT